MTDIKKLRELAEKATPGPWQILDIHEDSSKDAVTIKPGYWFSPGHRPRCYTVENPDIYENDAKFIAAANPETVIALLDRIEKLERIAQDFASHCEDCALLYSYDDENVKCNCGLQLALEQAEVP